MQNVGEPQFDYGSFKAAYDTDPRVKTMVRNFNEVGVEPKTAKEPEEAPQGDSQDSGDSITQMATRATNPGAPL